MIELLSLWKFIYQTLFFIAINATGEIPRRFRKKRKAKGVPRDAYHKAGLLISKKKKEFRR